MSFSLRWLFAVVAIAALFAAALSHPTPTWDAVTFNVTIALLVLGALVALLASPKRPFWIAASFVGWAHLVLDSFPFSLHSPPAKLFTRRLSYELWAVWQSELYNSLREFGDVGHDHLFVLLQSPGRSLYSDEVVHVLDIMQCVFTFLLGVVAGIIASYCVRRSSTPAEH
jgi:hypothetical protein